MSKTPLTRKPAPPPYFVFAAGLLAGKTDRQAAIDAGYAPGSAASRALAMKSHPEVIASIEAGKRRLRKATDYDAESAFKELDDTIDRATEAKQFNAVVKAIEAKSRMVGILDKPNALLTINVNEALEQARGRLLRIPRADEVQDVETIDVVAALPRAVTAINIFE